MTIDDVKLEAAIKSLWAEIHQLQWKIIELTRHIDSRKDPQHAHEKD